MTFSIRFTVLSTLFASSVWGHSSHDKRAPPKPQVFEACTQPNDIALTFDDGPWIHLRNISDQFTNAGAKATFFFNGNNFDCIYNPDRISDIKYAFNAGHMIGSHTWSHADLNSLSTPQIQDAMFRMEEAFSRILGIKPAFMRPPFGDFNSNVQSIAAARGQSLALWDWDTGDADGNTTAQSEAVYNDVANAKVSNALILEHETEDTTASTLVPFAIKLFQGKGYNLVTMATCLGVDPYQAIGVPQQQTAAWTCDGTPDPGEACSGSQCETGTPVFSSTTTAPGGGATPPATKPNQFIHPNANASKCLTAASNADGAAVEISDCVSSGSTSQNWTISGSNIQIFGNKCLDVTNGATADGTKMQIFTCSANNGNQAWSISGTTIQWSGHSSCLDNTGGVLTNGNIVQIWTCTGGGNQKWTLTTGPGTGSTTPPPPPPTNGAHVISPGSSSTTCLTATSNADGATVVVQPCNGSAGQTWTQTGNTLVVFSNKCLDVTNGSTANGVKMQIWTCTTSDINQSFTVTSSKQITWTNKGECLDLTDGSLTSGNQVQMWACATGNTNQVWNIV